MVTIFINGNPFNIEVGIPQYNKLNSMYGYYLLCSLGGKLYFISEGYDFDIEFKEVKYSLE